MAKGAHLFLIFLLIVGGVLMAVAMIPLIILILIGIGLFAITTRQTPREITRRTALRS